MSKTKMRRFLRRPKAPEAKEAHQKWARLYTATLARAKAAGDPRVRDLQHFSADPEKALRKLSILSEVDLDREFPREP